MLAQPFSAVFFGTGPVAAATLRGIHETIHIQSVVTKRAASHHKGDAPVELVAQELGLTLHFASNRAELDTLIATEPINAEVGIVVDYGVIISAATIAHFPHGIINSHFSLLPEWRGADPITFSVLSGQPKTGVSLMVIDEGLDTGKLITQKTLPIADDDTTPSLTDKLVELSNTLLIEWLPKYVAGDVSPRQQPHPDRATHSRKLTKQDGILDFTKPAEVLEREIRAFTGWPKSRTSLSLQNGTNLDIIITQAHAYAAATNPIDQPVAAPGSLFVSDSELSIATSNGHLVIDQLQPAGKKEMPVQAFLNGYRSLL